jgi:probable rRNA maturation factor
MSEMIEIQNVSALKSIPEDSLMVKWAEHALDKQHLQAELTLRIVDEEEGLALNKAWRKKNYATNVLSFPVGESLEQAPNLLGDIVVCAPVVEQEALDQGKNSDAHWAHLIVHGVLHLQGYDHESDEQAGEMELKEIQILEKIGYTNPYETN